MAQAALEMKKLGVLESLQKIGTDLEFPRRLGRPVRLKRAAHAVGVRVSQRLLDRADHVVLDADKQRPLPNLCVQMIVPRVEPHGRLEIERTEHGVAVQVPRLLLHRGDVDRLSSRESSTHTTIWH